MEDTYIKTFDAGHNRIGTVSIEASTCFSCGKETECMISDCSEGEYDASRICLPCATNMFLEYYKNRIDSLESIDPEKD